MGLNKEVSQMTAMQAADKARQRGDIRGMRLGTKFDDYAKSKIFHSPDMLLTVPGNKDPEKVSIRRVEHTNNGYAVAVMTPNGGRFEIYIDITQGPPFQIKVPRGNGQYVNGSVDRRGAVNITKKIGGIRPTDLPLTENINITEHFMKENLEVKEFSLKQILENLQNIPKDGGAKFGDEVQRLNPQQKKDLMEKVRKFNEYGKVLRCETALMEMSKTLAEIGQMAESYAMTESGDYFQAETVKRDFQEVKKITKDFSKMSKQVYGELQQLNALYEDMGGKMQRYFEIQSLEEIAGAQANMAQASAPAP